MLRLPDAATRPDPLLLERSVPDAGVEDHEEDDHDVDHDHDEGGSLTRLIATVAVPALALLALFAWWMMPKETKTGSSPLVETAPQSVPAVEKAPDPKPEKAAATDVAQMEDTLKNFLQAKTPAEALRWVYQPEKIAPKLEAWLAGGAYKVPGYKSMLDEVSTRSENGHEITGLTVRDGNFEKRSVALVKTPEGYRMDWESWMGWSEMSWSDFKKQKPPTAKLFRVIVAVSDYYNFNFKSEPEWSCYRLESDDGEGFLYGYVHRASAIDEKLRPVGGAAKRKLILRLKFPGDPQTDNQVLIDEFVTDGWVLLDDAPSP